MNEYAASKDGLAYAGGNGEVPGVRPSPSLPSLRRS